MSLQTDFKYTGNSPRKQLFVSVVNKIAKLINGITFDLGANRGGTNIVRTRQTDSGLIVDMTGLPLGDTFPAGVAGDILYHNGTDWVVLNKPSSDKVLQNTSAGALSWVDSSGLPTGTVGQILYHNGTDWVVLAKPSATNWLQNTSAGSPSWVARTAIVESATATGVSLVTSDGKIKKLIGT